MTKVRRAMTRSVQNTPSLSMSAWVMGASTNPPIPVPETASPITRPRFRLKYCDGTAIAGV